MSTDSAIFLFFFLPLLLILEAVIRTYFSASPG